MATAMNIHPGPMRQRERRLFSIMIGAPIGAGILCLLLLDDAMALAVFGTEVAVRYLLAVACAIVAVSFWLYRYLQFGVLAPFDSLLGSPAGTGDDDDEGLDQGDDIAADIFGARGAGKPLGFEVREGDGSEICRESVSRLNAEIAALGRRNSVNLVCGFGAALGGIVLMYVSMRSLGAPADLPAFLYGFAPRFSLAAFLELFAYFFLRLYRNGLTEIKYYQNEITGIEAKHTALLAARAAGSDATLDEVILAFAKTDRNMILEKGQTTAALQLARLENAGMQASLKHVADIIRTGAKPGEGRVP
jgi:hypothetical protein